MDPGIALLKEKGGSLRQLAARLGIAHTSISRWKRVPQDRIVQIEKEFDIPREKLRPDLYKGMK